MSQSTSIGVPAIAIRSEDPDLLEWLGGVLDEPSSVDVTPGSRFVIYGRDHDKFLTQDNYSQKLLHRRAAICVDQQLQNSYLDLYRHNICHVIYWNQPFAAEALRLATFAATRQKTLIACNSYREFIPPPQIIDSTEYPVLTLDETSYLAPAQDFISRHALSDEINQSIALCLKEAVTNAVFHSFREPGTHNRKYTPATFHGLYDDDYIAVNFTLTPDWISLRVWDNSGSLGPLSVANSLDRHLSDQGLMDYRGRGFYLMQKLAHRLVVCIRRREETSVHMYFLRSGQPSESPRHMEVITL